LPGIPNNNKRFCHDTPSPHQMKKLAVCFLLLPVLIFAQNRLSVVLEGIKSSEGNIQVAVYNQSEGFLKSDHVYKYESIKARKGIMHIDIDDLPVGVYALAIFHDENGNNHLDTSWLGIPRESIGFSRARMKTFGPPSFRECAMKIDGNSQIRIVF